MKTRFERQNETRVRETDRARQMREREKEKTLEGEGWDGSVCMHACMQCSAVECRHACMQVVECRHAVQACRASKQCRKKTSIHMFESMPQKQ